MTGSVDTCLVVVRGNSGSGKSTTARTVRERVGAGVAWVEQDHLRRRVLAEHDRPGMDNIGLIDVVVRYALDAGFHVILDGILVTDHYEPMLAALDHDHRGLTRHFYFDVPLEETQRRHQGRSWAAEVGPERLAEWYRPGDLLTGVDQTLIGADISAGHAVEIIMDQVEFARPPVLERQPATAYLC